MINQNIEKIKEAFFSQLSHNLMTHASNIIGFSELMKNEELRQEDKLQYIQFVIELSNMILTLAEDVKSLNKLSPESFALNESKANLNSFMDEIYNAAQNSNEIADGVRFTLRKTLRDQDATFLIDKNKIFKMLNTLLRNSFESTVSGGIEFGYHLLHDAEKLEFFVFDTGRGMTEEQQKKLFDMESVSKQRNRGLGLIVMKMTLDELGEQLRIESKPGEGTRIYFTLPFRRQQAAAGAKPDSAAPDWHGKKVLVVDDNKMNYLLICKMLFSTGAEFVWASDAAECRGQLDAGRVDCVLMDVEMPGMNGFEASKIIKQTFPGLPVIIVTAHLGENVARRCLECGIDDYIIQPVHTKVLYEQLGKFLD